MPFISISTKPNVISTVTEVMIFTFVFVVIPFLFTNDSRFLLYIFVLTNQLCNLCDEFAKQNTVAKKNGTVGKIGNTIPTQPSASDIQPKTKNNILFIFIFFPPN